MKKGMTLIEIIIAMAIMGIVVILIGGLFSFSLINYEIGVDQRDEQFAVRLASDFITDRVRYVKNGGGLPDEVDVLSAVDNVPGFCYLYIEGNDLKFKDESGNVFVFTDGQIQNLSFTLRVENLTERPKVFLDFTITGIDGYTITSSVYFTNLRWDDDDVGITDGTVVKFKKP